MKTKKEVFVLSAFTLVELIVVITILAILGTIGFISFQGYSRDARDSVRVADIKSISKTLDLYAIQEGNYPLPENGEEITYSGAEVWTQGVFGETTRRIISSRAVISEVPTDPLTATKYTYSLLNTGLEYQLGTITEKSLSNNVSLTKYLDAGTQAATAYIVGNYNGQVAKVSTGATTYVLAVPTIINGDMSVKDIVSLNSLQKLVYNGYKNLPASYSGTIYNTVGESNLNLVNTGKVLVYTGDISTLSDESNLKIFADNLQLAYSGTSIVANSKIQTFLALDTTNNTQLFKTAGAIVNNNLGGSIELTSSSSSQGGSGGNPWDYPNDITQIFATNTAYTQNWAANFCDPSTINIVDVSPGTDVIPEYLTANTIYRFAAGNYSFTHRLRTKKCNGLIGNGDVTIKITTNEDLIYVNGSTTNLTDTDNLIISGITFDINNIGRYPILISRTDNITINNSILLNSVYSGFSATLSNNITLNNVTSHNNNGNGLYFSFSSSNHLINIISYNNGMFGHGLSLDNFTDSYIEGFKTFNNSVYGLYINQSGGNIYSNIITYYNGIHGINISNSDNNTFNNILIYGNKNTGIYIGSNSNFSTFNNLIVFNNTNEGIHLIGADNFLNNIMSYNNKGDGVQFYDNKTWLFNDLKVFNNKFYGTNQLNGSYGKIQYFGDIKSFSNGTDTVLTKAHESPIPERTIDLGLTIGAVDYSGDFSIDGEDYVMKLSKTGWDYTLRGAQCVTTDTCDNPVLSTDYDGTETYIYGSQLPNQIRPIKYNNTTSKYEYYGTDGVDYDSSKKIGNF